jgi:aminopeptidase N
MTAIYPAADAKELNTRMTDRPTESDEAVNSDTSYIKPEQKLFDVTHYDISVTIDHLKKLLSGDVTISGRALSDLNKLTFNLYDNLIIDSAFLGDQRIKFSRDDRHISIGRITIKKDDTISVRIIYHGTPKRLGFASFVFGEINNIPLVHTFNEPQYASTWLPCDDDPADKAMLDISISADSQMVSVSNGILTVVTSREDQRTYHYKTLYPIATYLICFYSSRYASFSEKYISSSGDTMPIEYYVVPKHLSAAKKDFSGQDKIIKIFSSLFGEYPFIKEKYGIAEFLWMNGAMEHQTMIGVSTTMITGERYYTDVLAHELAHHWWGNAVSPASWKDIWLNEGFASYSEALYEEQLLGQKGLNDKMDEFRYFTENDSLYAPSKDIFSSMVYHKGAWALHMLRTEVGDSAFFRILRTYFETYKYKNASTQDFIDICEQVSGKHLSKFFEQWLYGSHRKPELYFRWDFVNSSEGGQVRIWIEQIQDSGYLFDLPLDIKITYDDSVLVRSVRISRYETVVSFASSKMPNTINLDPEHKLLVSIREPSYNEEQNTK